MKSNHYRLTPLIGRPGSPASQRFATRRSVVKRQTRRLERRIWAQTVRDFLQDVDLGASAAGIPVTGTVV